MSSAGEAPCTKQETNKNLQTPKNRPQRSFFDRLFRRKKLCVADCNTHENGDQDGKKTHDPSEDLAISEATVEVFHGEPFQEQYCEITSEPSFKDTQKTPRCKTKKNRRQSLEGEDISSVQRSFIGDELQELRCKEFIYGNPYLSPSSKQLARDIINQRPKTPYKAKIQERLQDQCLGAFTESKTLEMCPAFSIGIISKSFDDATKDANTLSKESETPKTRKGALKENQKPIKVETPVVAYTRGYQSDSDSANSTSSSDSCEVVVRPPPVRVIRPANRQMPSICYSMKRPDITDEDRRRMNAYLNQFSSVHISRNLKDPIPKDPETLPGFHANASRRQMAEALSKHGSSLFGRSQATTPAQRKKNAKDKKKKSSWFFPASTGDVTMPGEQKVETQDSPRPGRSATRKRVENGSEMSTEIRCHDLTKEASSSSAKPQGNTGETEENATSGRVRRIVNDRNLQDERLRATPSPSSPDPSMMKPRKSYRSLHDNPTSVVADLRSPSNERRRIYRSSEDVERKEVFLVSVDSEFDDLPPGASNHSNYVVRNVVARKYFPKDFELEEKRPKNNNHDRGRKENARLIKGSSILLPKVSTKRGNSKAVFSTTNVRVSDSTSLSANQSNDSVPLRRREENADGPRTESRTRRWEDDHADRVAKRDTEFKYEQDTNISWVETAPPLTRQRAEETDADKTTLNWTIIMKHTRRKCGPSSAELHFTDR